MRCNVRSHGSLLGGMFVIALSACNGNGGLSSTAPGVPPNDLGAAAPIRSSHRHGASGKIKHVVIIIQENRSLNDLFYGFPGATTQGYGYTTSGQKIQLKPVPLASTWDLAHSAAGFFAACNGTGSIPGTDCQMNGFNNEEIVCGKGRCPSTPQYTYVQHSDTKPLFALAKQYVLADQMYASNFDASSFISHQYIIAAQAEGAVDYPAGVWGCPGGSGDTIPILGPDRQIPYGYEQACFDDSSIGEEADNAGVSWAYYGGTATGDIWTAYMANQYVYYGSDWKNDVINSPSQFLTDVSNGKLRQITWITPTWTNSDHPGSDSNAGPSWVAALVNVIGQSKFWDSTAIFIFWDDYGGFFDPEPPAYVDYDGLGIRLPMLIVSAYAKKRVSHVHYEHGSILKFVEDQFGLGRLSASDRRATSPEKDGFDFKKPPRAFKVIPTVVGKDYFLHQPPDYHPLDNQ